MHIYMPLIICIRYEKNLSSSAYDTKLTPGCRNKQMDRQTQGLIEGFQSTDNVIAVEQ